MPGSVKVTVRPSSRKNKKYAAVFEKGQAVHFGEKGSEDFTMHGDEKRKTRYVNRHRSRENWTENGLRTAGFWSRWLLWNKPSIAQAIQDMNQQFRLTVTYSDSSSPSRKQYQKAFTLPDLKENNQALFPRDPEVEILQRRLAKLSKKQLYLTKAFEEEIPWGLGSKRWTKAKLAWVLAWLQKNGDAAPRVKKALFAALKHKRKTATSTSAPRSKTESVATLKKKLKNALARIRALETMLAEMEQRKKSNQAARPVVHRPPVVSRRPTGQAARPVVHRPPVVSRRQTGQAARPVVHRPPALPTLAGPRFSQNAAFLQSGPLVGHQADDAVLQNIEKDVRLTVQDRRNGIDIPLNELQAALHTIYTDLKVRQIPIFSLEEWWDMVRTDPHFSKLEPEEAYEWYTDVYEAALNARLKKRAERQELLKKKRAEMRKKKKMMKKTNPGQKKKKAPPPVPLAAEIILDEEDLGSDSDSEATVSVPRRTS